MSTKLSTITTQYRRFTKNQVLTEGHLNEIVDFFDDQDRLSRICLSGVGIVCGFIPSCDDVDNTITITQGAGVTTDGDLFHLYSINSEELTKTIEITEKEYTHYKVYNNEKANYNPYFYDGGNQLEIYELLTADQLETEKDDFFSLGNLQSNVGIPLKEAVVLLYLEKYEKEKDLCVSLSCDNQGLEIIGNYKALIVSKSVADQINDNDPIISKVNYANLYHQLPDVLSNRVVLKKEDFDDYQTLKESFVKGMLKNNVVSRLKLGFQTLLTALQMPVLLQSIEDNIDDIFTITIDNVPPDFQYRYDVLKDVIDTYNEIKGLLFGVEENFCCPDIKSFPKHLMLGEVEKNGPCYEYRHAFYKSPILTGQNLSSCNDCVTNDPIDIISDDFTLDEVIIDSNGDELNICYGENSLKQKFHSLIKRAVQLLANYNANYNYVKVTPSLELGKLGNKAIPFYTNLGDHLIQLWDYDKTVLGRYRDNLGYHRDRLNLKKPLEISLDHDFYRIEGHQGRNYKEALKLIQDIRRENGLGFNIVVLKVKSSELDDFITNYTQFYLSKNHGFEHKAGVAPGGTFIMVYIDGEYKSYPYPYGYGYPYQYPNFPSLAGDFEDEIDEELSVFNPVVADFTLPYLCCDENFIGLSLPVQELCFDSSTEPIPFHVTPTGGYVEADVAAGVNGGVTKNVFGEFVFDPNLVSEELIGETIRFTVNNFETECEITILQKPEFSIEVDNVSEPNDGKVTVTFNIIGNNIINGTVFTWNFGDDTGTIDSSQRTIQHTYTLGAPGESRFTVRVISGTGTCTSETEEEITLSLPDDVTVSIDQTTICRGDDTFHQFIVDPDDAQVDISGDGVSVISGNFVFRATDVPDSVSSVQITVNGQMSDIVITIQEEPQASFSHTIEDNTLVLSNNSDHANTYVWNVAGEIIERNIKSQVRRSLDLYESSTIQVSLQAVSNLCGRNTDGPRSIPIREGNVRCIDIIADNLQKSNTALEEIRSSEIFDQYSDLTINALNGIDEIVAEISRDPEAFSKGDQNGILREIFKTDLLFDLPEAVRSARTEEERESLRTITEVYSITFYDILRCQDIIIRQEFAEIIAAVGEEFNEVYNQFIELKFNVDIDGSLKAYLEEISNVLSESDFIVNQIDQHLEALGKGEQF